MKYNVSFEATGFTDDKALIGQTITEQEAIGFTQVSIAEGSFPSNVISVVGGYVTDDDAQGDTDIHVFVHIELVVVANNETEAESMVPPAQLLSKLSDMMSEGFGLDLESNSWEVTDVAEHGSEGQKLAQANKFTDQDADRLLGLSDQFLEDWEEDEKGDPEVIERRAEYDAIRPIFMTAPSMLAVLQSICPGIRPLPDGVFRIVREFEDRRDWICIIKQADDGRWWAEHNDCTDCVPFASLAEALQVVSTWGPTDCVPKEPRKRKNRPAFRGLPALSLAAATE